MAQATIDRLIVNSPYAEPTKYWSYDRERLGFELKDGRRPAGYVIASEGLKSFDDPGVFVPIPLVNRIRPRVAGMARGGVARRHRGYPAAAGALERPGGFRGRGGSSSASWRRPRR